MTKVELRLEIDWPKHAMKRADGQYVVCHAVQNGLSRVCRVGADGYSRAYASHNYVYVYRSLMIHVYWHCPYRVRSSVYVTVGCPSVRLSVPPDRSSAACGGFAVKRHAGGTNRSTAAGDQEQRRRSTPQHGAHQQTRAVPCSGP